MRRRILLGIGLVSVALIAHGQEPPRLLPSSITGAKNLPASPVSPVAGTQVSPVAPIGRFRDTLSFPPETTSTLAAVRSGAEWLWRMNQPDGRFAAGLNPSTHTLLPSDDDLTQAISTAALAEAAQFTGDDRLTARATQAVLTLLTRTKPTATAPTYRMPTTERNPVAVAALLVLAIGYLPGADARITQQAEELTSYLQKQCRTDGSLHVHPTDDPMSAGLALQAIAASNRLRPEVWKSEVLSRAIGFYKDSLREKPDPLRTAALIPGFVDFALTTQTDRATAAILFVWADALCDRQVVSIDPRNPMWLGGFPTSAGDPSYESTIITTAIVHATKLTRHVPDLTRYQRYRQASVSGLAFTQRLQFPESDTPASHSGSPARYLTGGVQVSPKDGTVRADATAYLVRAGLTFLQSGAEGRTD